MHLFVKTEKSKDMTSSNQNISTASYKGLILAFIFIFSGIFFAMGQDPSATISTSDTTICADLSSFYIDFALAANDSAVKWTTTGTGSFNDENDTTTYFQSLADKSAGSVILKIFVYPKFPSTHIDSTKFFTLNFTDPPIITNPGTITRCSSYTLPPVPGSNISPNAAYFTLTNRGGIKYVATDLITTSGTLYINDSTATCSDEESFYLTIDTPPVVNAGNDTTICSGQNFILPSLHASASNNNGILWTTNGTGAITSGASTLTPTYTPGVGETGTITFTLTATAIGSCSNASDYFILTINPQPIISNPGPITRCSSYTLPTVPGSNITVNAAYFTGMNRTGDRYDVGDNITISGTLYINDSTATCSDEESFYLTIDTPPIVNAGNDTTTCSGQNFNLPSGHATASNHGGILWTTNGTGSISSGAASLTPTYTPGVGETGTITLTLTATAIGSCSNLSDDFILTINPQPIITNPGTINRCSSYTLPTVSGANITVNAAYFTGMNRTGDRYDAGDVISASDILYINDSTATCSDEEFFQVNIDTPPTIEAGAPASICSGQTYSIPGGHSTATNHNGILWTHNGTGSITSGANTLTPTYTPGTNETGNVTLTLTATAIGACADVNDEFTLTITPTPNITNPTAQTACDSYTLLDINGTNLSGTEAYYLISGGIGTAYHAGHTITTTTTVYIYDSNGSCSDEESFTVNIIDAPVITNPGPQTACTSYSLPNIVGTNLSGSQAYYLTSGGIGTALHQGDPITTTSTVFIYDIKNTCSDEESFLVTILPVPNVDDIADQLACGSYTLPPITGPVLSGNQAYYTESGGNGIRYEDGDVITNSDIIFIYDNNGYCSDEESFSITIQPEPTVDAGANTSLCGLNAYTLNGSAADYDLTSIVWTKLQGGGTLAPLTGNMNPIYTPVIGDYGNTVQLRLTVSGLGPCSGNTYSDDVYLYYSDHIEVDAGPATAIICETDTYTTEASTNTPSTYIWTNNGGDGTFANDDHLNTIYTPGATDIANGTVTLTLTATGAGTCLGNDDDDITLRIKKLPTVNAGPASTTICETSTYTTTDATALNYDNLTWTIIEGGGSISSASSLTAAEYIPGQVAIDQGYAILRLRVTSLSPCYTSVFDDIRINITPEPEITVGTIPTLCQEADYTVTIADTAYSSSVLWEKISGTGVLINATTINPTYTPSATDATSGSIVLRLTASATSPCTASTTQNITFQVAGIPTVDVGSNVTVCENTSSITLSPTVTNGISYLWTTSGSGTFSPSTTTLNPTYNPVAGDYAAGTIRLKLVVTGSGLCSSTVSDSLNVTFTPAPTALVNATANVCQGVDYIISSATATNYSDITWTHDGDGTLNNIHLEKPTYTQGAADIGNDVTFTITVTGNGTCTPVQDQLVLSVLQNPSVNLNITATTVCGANYQISNVVAANYNTLTWTSSGNGSFDNANALNPRYTFGSTDIAAGAATLTLTASPNSPCATNAVKSFIINISDGPVANAGPDASICETQNYITSTASSVDHSSVEWSVVNGTGTFITSPNNLTTTYQPSANDISLGSVTLRLTSYGIGSCTADTDDIIITITKQPAVDAGDDADGCIARVYTVSDASIANHNTYVWTTNGHGTLNNETTLTPSYTPHIDDINLNGGVVTLTLTASSNAPCSGNVTDTKVLTIYNEPTAFAGNNAFVCAASDYEIQGATATYYSSLSWSSSSSGIFGFINNGTLTPTYQVNATDAANGYVDITLSVAPKSPCATPATNTFRLTVLPGPTADAGANDTICVDGVYSNTDADTTNATSILWQTSGDGTFSSTTAIHPSYTPGTADKINGSVTLTLHAYGIGSNGCNHDVSDLTLTINRLPTADAGSLASICEGSNIITGASVANNSGLFWRIISGTGTLLNNNSLTPIYNTSAADTAAGTISLELVALPNAPCADSAFSTISLPVIKAPIVDAGADTTVCRQTPYHLWKATSNNLSNKFSWTTSGTGIFSNINSLNPVYTPSAADVLLGAITLTITASNSSCNDAVDFMTLALNSTTVDAGADAAICFNSNYTANATITGNYGAILWTHNGSGSFLNGVDNTTTPTYVPATGDEGTTVTLLITVNEAGACSGVVSDAIDIAIKNIPLASAGNDTTICETENLTFSNGHASASYAPNIFWTSSGDGTFSGGGLTPTYNPGTNDLAQGFVDLTIHGENPPCQEATDVMRLTFEQLTTLDAGANASIYLGSSFTVSTATLSDNSPILWTSSGTGTFSTGSETTLTPTYTPSNLDFAIKNVWLILTASPTISCNVPVKDSMKLTVNDTIVDFSWVSSCVQTPTQFNIDETVTDLGSIATYHWDFGDGQISTNPTDPNPTNTYNAAGTYKVILTAVDTTGYTNVVWHYLTVNELPIVNFNYTQPLCSGNSTIFTDQSVAPSGYIVERIWDFGDGTEPLLIDQQSSGSVEHTYASAGTYPVTLTVMASDSCLNAIQKDVLVTSPPQANFSYADTCFGSVTTFNDASIISDNISISKWNWDFGDESTGVNNTSTLKNPSHIFSESGTYLVNLQTENINGCIDDTTMSVMIVAPPVIEFDYTTVCLNEEVSFTPSSNPNFLYSWNFGDDTPIDNYEAPTHTFEGQGPYEVVLTVIDTTTNCSASVSHSISFAPLPTAVFSISEGRCMSELIEFTDHSFADGSSITKWEWNFGDNSDTTILEGNNPDVSHTFARSGEYTVTLVVTNANSCIDSVQSLINIKAAPKANFEYDISCFEGTSSFTDLSYAEDGSPIIQWAWDFGDPLSGNLNTSNLKNPTHAFLTDTANVYLKVTNDNGCSSDTTIGIKINTLEDVAFEIIGGTCLNNETTFKITEPIDLTNYIVEWNFGDPSSGQSNTSNSKVNPSHIYILPGQYQVTLTIFDQNGCSNSFTNSVNIKSLPGVQFDTDAPSCQGKEVQFTYFYEPNGSIIDSLLWEFGDGTDTIIKRGESWNISHLYSIAGEKNTKLTVYTENGCAAESPIKKINILRGPVANFLATSVCIDHFAEFTDFSQEGEGGTIIDWLWDFGDPESGSNSSGNQNPTHKYINSGKYGVSLTVTDVEGCSDTQLDSIDVFNNVLLENKPFTFNNVICENTMAEFFMNTTINLADVQTILWDFGDLGSGDRNTSNEVNPIHVYKEPGEYTITLTLDNNNCGGTIDTTIIVSPKPIANFEFFNACVGKPTEFTDISISELNPINNWSWNFGVQNLTNDTSTLQNPLYTYNATGNYLVSLEVINDVGCTDILDSVEIEITPTPTAKFSFAETGQGEISFTNESTNATSYEWDFGDNWISDEINPIHQYDSAGTLESSKYEGLSLQLISLNDFECADTAIRNYDLYFKGLYIPTAFIPDPIDPSSYFKAIGVNLQSFNIEVYSSWGQLVWQSSALDENGRPTESWDGMYNGENSPPGPYLWKANGVFKDGTIWKGNDLNNSGSGSTSGTIMLIR